MLLRVIVLFGLFMVGRSTTTYYTKEITACGDGTTGRESCFWSLMKNESEILSPKLLIYFSGGQMTCPNMTNPGANYNYLVQGVNAGYVAVCARLFNSSFAAGLYPYHLEAERANQLVSTIMTDPDVTKSRTGENFLISGDTNVAALSSHCHGPH